MTGAAGFVGSHTVDLLLQEGHEVIGVDNLRTGHERNLERATVNPRFRFVRQDITEDQAFAVLTTEISPYAIIHLAALVSVPESIREPAENYRLNVLASRLVAAGAASANVRRIVFASSAAVYGTSACLPLTEDAECFPVSPYGEAKLDTERMFFATAANSGIIVRCHRFFNIFGPRQDPSSAYSGVISRFAAAFRDGLSPIINGDGEQTRDFISVKDVARANLIAATRSDIKSGVANICTGRSISLNRLFETMGRIYGHRHSVVHAPNREGDIQHSLGDPERARRELGFEATTSLEDGLRLMAAIP